MKNTNISPTKPSENQLRNKQRGFTIIELLIGVAILSIVYIAFATIMNDSKDSLVLATKESLQMQSTMSKLNARYQDEPLTKSVVNKVLIDNRIIAENYKIDKAASKIYNTFGGVVTINGVDGNGLTWESKGVPVKACDKLAADNGGLGFETVRIGSTNLQYSASKTADFSAACTTAAGTNDVVTLLWTRAAST